MGLSEGEVVNVPFPLCEADDSERKSVYVCWLLCRCALKLGSTRLVFVMTLRYSDEYGLADAVVWNQCNFGYKN